MRLTASAPGKLVLLGEYAVLEGAPALVLAVNRRARVTLDPVDGDAWDVRSPTLGMQARLRIRDGHAAWAADAHPELAWIATLLERFPDIGRLPACRIELDSDAFYLGAGNEPALHPERATHVETHAESGGAMQARAVHPSTPALRAYAQSLPRTRSGDERLITRPAETPPAKLGLGSSAALTVALLGALHACAGQARPTLEECVQAHRAVQHGRGSGIDVAASLSGGLSRYCLAGRSIECTAMSWPDGLDWRCIYSGRPASTGAMLAAVATWRARAADEYGRRMRELGTISSRGVDAVATNDAATLLASLRDYSRALADFGAAAGVDIVSREHRALASIADAAGCVYKSCGAGGGDVGVTFAVEDIRLRDVSARVARAGFPVIALAADPQGLEVTATA